MKNNRLLQRNLGILFFISLISISYQIFSSQPAQYLRFVDIAMDSNKNLYVLDENLHVYKKEKDKGDWKEIDLASIPAGITLKKDEHHLYEYISRGDKHQYLLSFESSDCGPIKYVNPEKNREMICAEMIVGWVLYRLENNQWVEKMRLGTDFKVRNFVAWSDDYVVILRDDGVLMYRVVT